MTDAIPIPTDADPTPLAATPPAPDPAEETAAPPDGALAADQTVEGDAAAAQAGDPAALDDPSVLTDPALLPDPPTFFGVPLPEEAAQALEMVAAGGPVVIILIGLSVFALAIVLLKLWQFRAARLGQTRVARDALALFTAGRAREAIAVAGRCRNPAAQALARAMRGQARGLAEDKVREEVLRTGTEALHTLRGGFRTLEMIASLAPLLGLFGTVLGMIEAFRQLEAAGNQVNPAILSGGIWEALLTTAVGLAVAIPVVAVLTWLERRVDRVAHEMEVIVTRVFTEDLSQDPPEDHGSPHEEVRHDGSRRLTALGA